MKYEHSNLRGDIDRIKIYLFTKNVTGFFVGIKLEHVHDLFDPIFLL